MSDILRKIVAKKREEVAALKLQLPLAQVRDQALAQPPALDFTGALMTYRPRGLDAPAAARVHVIAELKRRSPSKGEFNWHGDAARQACDYQRGGAKAISVVTDESFFGGSEQLLREVKAAVTVPVLQKEFVLEPWQVYRARAIGADAVLLIAAILPGGMLGELIAQARQVGLHTLVEVVDEAEHGRATAGGAAVIGVNNRDLRDFSVDLARTERLLPLYRDDQVAVCESGINAPEQVARMLRAGVDGFLIGEALMVAPDPAAYLTTLREQGAKLAAVPLAAARRHA